MAVYRELFYNNVEDFIATTYPVLKELLGEDAWHSLVRDYFAIHRARTPLFMQMPREFLVYLEQERDPQPDDFPFMLELAHYEWVELDLATSDKLVVMDHIDANGDLLTGIPVVSPLARILTYSYAVHRIGTEYIPTEEDREETYLVVLRDRNDDVQFIEINRVTAALLIRLQEEKCSAKNILIDIGKELNHPDPAQLLEFGQSILNDMHARGVILGTRM